MGNFGWFKHNKITFKLQYKHKLTELILYSLEHMLYKLLHLLTLLQNHREILLFSIRFDNHFYNQ